MKIFLYAYRDLSGVLFTFYLVFIAGFSRLTGAPTACGMRSKQAPLQRIKKPRPAPGF
jgi:hypothetical protein